MELRFDDRVIVVTGAGNGLGKSHALDFARRGGKLVINDLGGSGGGEGSDPGVAELVVREISSAGGTAIANGDSVEHGDRIIEQAMDVFGRIDVLVNNAGVLRDASFHKLKEAEWEAVYRTHLYGSWRTTHAAWGHMRNAGYGRVIMTSSAAGLYGNFGQANYAAAKLGILGLARTLAVEGGARGILTNTIAPIAASRLTAGVMPPAMLAALKPEYVTALVTLLCHESSIVNGGLFEVGGGWITSLRLEQALGATFADGAIDAESVRARWAEIATFDGAGHPATIQESLINLGQAIGVPVDLSVQ